MSTIDQGSGTALSSNLLGPDFGMQSSVVLATLLSIAAFSPAETPQITDDSSKVLARSLDHSLSTEFHWAESFELGHEGGESLLRFASKLIMESQDLPEDLARVIDENFWDLI